jgi:hypothetical protein
MKSKYLLYIDILGFSEMVRNRPEDARRLYKIIEDLNCHKHDAFQVIVFSDTILIYNKFDPFLDNEHSYAVMYLIEFAQNLLYETIGKGYFFRAVLVNGEFEHARPNNVERIFGKALVTAYLAEKSIPCTGLFIDSASQRRNIVFSVEPFNEQFSFVYLNQSLDRLSEGSLGAIPVDAWLLEQTDSQWSLSKDVRFLSDVYEHMRSHPNPRVRQKFLMTWDYYLRRYSDIMLLLVQENFHPECISPKFDWTKATKRILEGFRGASVEPPTVPKLQEVIEEARTTGAAAASKECLVRLGEEEPPADKYFLPCGGAWIILDVDGKSRLGRSLLKHSSELKRASIEKDFKNPKRGLLLTIHDMHSRQEMAIDEVAAKAALEIIKDRLDIDGFVDTYID